MTDTSKLTIKIPEKIFVAIDALEIDRISYITSFEKNAPFKKRATKLCNVAYRGAEPEFDMDAEKVTISAPANSRFDMATVFIEKRLPAVIPNTLVEGFEVSTAVRRKAHWRSNDDIVWRIRDPRNFDTVISSGNFLRIVENTTIVNGKIQGNCVWAMDGQEMVLLPENSELYKEASKYTTKLSQKLTIRDIHPGDEVEILSNKINSGNPTKVEFCGKYTIFSSGPALGQLYYDDTAVWRLGEQEHNQYIVKYNNGYYALQTFKVINVITKLSKPKSKIDVAHEINKNPTGILVRGISYATVVVPKKDETIELSIELVDEPAVFAKWGFLDNSYEKDQVIFELDGELYSSAMYSAQIGSSSNRVELPLGLKIKLDTSTASVRYETTQAKITSGWRMGQYDVSRIWANKDKFDIRTAKKYRVKVNYGEFSAIPRSCWR